MTAKVTAIEDLDTGAAEAPRLCVICNYGMAEIEALDRRDEPEAAKVCYMCNYSEPSPA